MSLKVFINDKNMATFICPKCEKSKTTNVSKYKQTETSVRVNCKCPCGHSYSVLLERRKHTRKKISLIGTYSLVSSGDRGQMTVIDISRTGLRIRLSVKREFELGEKLKLEFTLNDQHRSLIRREVYVRSLKDQFIGVEFCQMEHYDQLGSYLAWNVG